MKRLILFFVSILSIMSQAQDFKVDFDCSRFLYNDSSNYLEIYYSFYQPQLKQVKTDNELKVKGILNIKILNKATSDTVVNRNYQFENIISDSMSVNHQKSFTGNMAYILPLGEYNCVFTGMDGNDMSKLDSISFPLTISELPKDRFSISDLEIASLIKHSEDDQSMFFKNTYEVVPNPSGIFGQEIPVLYFYAEIYNLEKDIQSENLRVDHMLLNSSNKTVYKKSRLFPRSSGSAVDVGAINIS
ncbi:MAG TPA: hypothetical protein VI230_08910, partial [Ignavibacteriaceae bacterium]